MAETLPTPTPEKSNVLDDNARKFIVDDIDRAFLDQHCTASYIMTVDWLETHEATEKKLAYKKFDSGEVQILLIEKETVDGKRTSRKDNITEETYKELLGASVLRVEKRRSELEYVQADIVFTVKFDEFSDSTLSVIEIDAPNEDDRKAFKPEEFPATVKEVTGDIAYYGYRIAAIL